MRQNETIEYYNQKAKEYIKRTFSHNMSEDQSRFLKHLKPKEKILDAGCGSGRDALAFQKEGFHVLAFDASSEMVKHTKSLGVNAQIMRFDDMAWQEEFDGIWCSASLLHVSRQDLPQVIKKLHAATKKNGILFISFKKGDGERFENGRYFHMMDEQKLLSLFGSFTLLDMWSQDSDVNLVPTTWLKAVFRKST